MYFSIKTLIQAITVVSLTLGLTQMSFSMDQVITHGALQIISPRSVETPPNASVGAGYMIIKNTGETDDILLSGSVEFAQSVEIHEMKVENDVMKMRPMLSGIVIPAGGMIELKPGGFHLMFMKLDAPFKVGDVNSVTLSFKNAGDIELDFSVLSRKDILSGNHGAKHGHKHH